MSDRSAEHATFNIERTYNADPARVFKAWTEPDARSAWFGPTDTPGALSLDFRIGGREHFTMPLPDGRKFAYDAHFHEIVPEHRIVYAYSIDFDEARVSVSLVTVELTPADAQTRLLYTEQAVYLDGGDTPEEREEGTRVELEQLAAALAT
jgi:uncharacterized protein YndB with AHSA1/START domain